MRIRIDYKETSSESGVIGVYGTHLESIREVGHVLNQKPFIELTWRRPARASKGELGYTDCPVLVATDTIASVSAVDDE